MGLWPTGAVSQPECQKRDFRQQISLREVERHKQCFTNLFSVSLSLSLCLCVCACVCILPGTREGLYFIEHWSSQTTHKLAHKTVMKKILREDFSLGNVLKISNILSPKSSKSLFPIITTINAGPCLAQVKSLYKNTLRLIQKTLPFSVCARVCTHFLNIS